MRFRFWFGASAPRTVVYFSEESPLQLAFNTRELRTLCESEDAAREAFGDDVAESLKARLADLRAAENIDDLVVGRPRTSADSGMMVLDLHGSHVLKFVPNHVQRSVDAPKAEWGRVKRIKVTSIGKHEDGI